MPLSRIDLAASSIYKNAVPPRAPFSGLSALSELAAELTEVNELASKTLIDSNGIFCRLLALFRKSKLPMKLEGFAAHMKIIAQRSLGENLFFDNDAMPISMERVDITFETMLRPLVNLAYILENGAINPPRRVDKVVMTLVIAKVASCLSDLGEGLRSDLSHQPYQRSLHIVTRLMHAEAAWRRVAEAHWKA